MGGVLVSGSSFALFSYSILVGSSCVVPLFMCVCPTQQRESTLCFKACDKASAVVVTESSVYLHELNRFRQSEDKNSHCYELGKRESDTGWVASARRAAKGKM